MLKGMLRVSNWLSGVQWLFFIFTNIIVIPITVGAAFELPQSKITGLLELSFILTGVACVMQALLGHKRPIMEGNSGLWWGVVLTLTSTAAAHGMSLSVLGGSLTVGIIISGILTVIIGLAGFGPYIAKLFNPGVMGVFMLLFGIKLIGIFMEGMLGIPFENSNDSVSIDIPVSILSILIVALVIFVSIKTPPAVRQYALLIGIVVGWIVYDLIFGQKVAEGSSTDLAISLFPLRKPAFNIGVIITAIITGFLNTANTFGALKGTDDMFEGETSAGEYRRSFTITGAFIGISGFFGLVPFSPYVSTIGFLKQTGFRDRMPFILGGLLFCLMGLIPPVGHFFSMLPLSIGSAVLFVAYLQLLSSSWSFFKNVNFNSLNIYRSAIPLFVGIIIMTMPPSYFNALPDFLRPVLSSGLLMGIILAVMLENVIDWDKYIDLSSNEEKPDFHEVYYNNEDPPNHH